MLSRYFTLVLTLFVGGIPPWILAQPFDLAEGAAVTYLERNWNRHDLASQADVAELIVTDAAESRHGGATSVHLRQGIDGISVIDGQMVIAVDENGHVFHAAGQLIPDLASRTIHSGSGFSPTAAASAIASEAGFPAPVPFQVAEPGVGATQRTVLTDGGGHSHQPVIAELVYIVDDAGNLRLAWDATVTLHGNDGQWRGLIDAGSGAVLRLDDVLVRDHWGTPAEAPMIVKRERSTPGMTPLATSAPTPTGGSATYEVVAWPQMDPFHTSPVWPDDGRSIVSGVEDPTASPCGWHDIDDPCDGADYTITRGNNVHAYADWTSSIPPEPDGGAELAFEFPIDFTEEPETYVDASTTNLFYWNNLFHDVMVHYGFDEAHWNFQEHNYTGNGDGGDYVNAEAQDNNEVSCNNANFSRTIDGQNPRMQMFLGCNHTPKMDGNLDNHVIIHEYGHGVSIRMTGGGSTSSCLSNHEHGGEGWSDWYGLMLTQDETDDDFGRNQSIGAGVFLFHDDNPDGIRPAPYNTDFAVNDFTYGDIGGQVFPHGVGFVWATILWEVTWDLIDEHGFTQDITDVEALTGNIIIMNLVTEALNMTPCSPGFVDQRDAIFAAVDVVYGDQDEQWRSDLKQVLWGGFARRGLGFLADQGSPSSTGDETEDFTVPSEIAPNAITDLAADPDGNFVTLTWTAPSDDDSDVLNYHVRYANASILDEDDWDAATDVPDAASLVPQAPGETEELLVSGLSFETTYYFVVRSDDGINLSDLSNNAEIETLAPPVADVPTDPIEVTLPPDGTDSYAFPISNLGPATLSFSINLTETTEDYRKGEPVPRPESPADWEPPVRGDEETPEPTGEPQFMGEGGPDAFGYRWIDSNEPGGPSYDWIDVSETGTELTLGVDDYAIVDLPFDFPYYGNTYDWVAIQSKGALVFENDFVGYANESIPTTDLPNAIVAGYWDDLNPHPTFGDGAVYYGEDDEGRFVVSWVGVPHHPNRGSYTFQIILEPDGAIVTQYEEIAPDPADENSATIGIESPDGADGLQVVYNAEYVEEELAIRFSALSVTSEPSAGAIAAGEEETITLTFDAVGLEPGTYTADMTVTTNEAEDGLTQEYIIPITLTIGAIGTEDDAPAFEGTHRLSAIAPNPMNGLARTTLEVAEAQDVTVEFFDVRGRKVATPFEGALATRTAEEIALNGGALAPGVYVLRISGETFAETRRVTVVR